MEQRDFFISYTNADEAWAVWIANVLKSNGYTVYIQALDIKPGDNFLEKMNEFLKNSRNFIAVWSKAYPQSRFCMAELQSAFYAWNKENMKCLLPVRIDNFPLEPLYAGLLYVDLPDMSEVSETKLVNYVRDAPIIVPQEDAETLYQQGLDYYFGENGVAQDYAKAQEYWEQAAAKGHAEALWCLGVLYDNGDGVAQDYAKARNYYEQAAAKGNVKALHDLSYLYSNGLGVAQDYAKARNYYEQAAAKGSVNALYNLGIYYEFGWGVSIDYAKALEYYQKAADAGNKEAPARVEKLRKKLSGE